jgi:hypothetical protein
MIKKLLSVTAVSLAAVFAVSAQTTIPNGNFESWNGNEATGWTSLNNVAPPLTTGSCVKATAPADIHGGTGAVILTTKNIIGNIAPGTVATGATINLASQSLSGGIDFSGRPDSLTGWYKYTPVGSDAGNIVGILFNSTRDTVATAVFFPAGTVSSYTYFKAEFTYRIPDAVDSALFVLASSGTTGGQANTKMYADDLNLVYNPTVGIDNPSASKMGVYPNPASETIHVDMTGVQNASILIFDITGKKVAQHALAEKVTRINITDLAKGMYVYQLNAENNETLKTGKFIVK